MLHFSLSDGILVNPDPLLSIDAMVNIWLSHQKLGTISPSFEWHLAVTLDDIPADNNEYVSFSDFLALLSTTGKLTPRESPRDMMISFTDPKSPGERLRPSFDLIVKALSVSQMIRKAYGLDKSALNTNLLQTNMSQSSPRAAADPASFVKGGYHRLFPSFVNLLTSLASSKRKYSVVLHGTPEEVSLVVEELNAIFDGGHPCYSGANKTSRILLDGSKGSTDMRVRVCGKLEMVSDESVLSFDNYKDGLSFKGVQEIHAGLLYDICDNHKIVAISEDHGNLTGSYYDESSLHQIFLSSNESKVKLIDPVSYEAIDPICISGRSFVKIDSVQAALDNSYFQNVVEQAEREMIEFLAPVDETPLSSNFTSTEEATSPKSYLLKKVMPALIPVINLCCRDRPHDPMLFIAAGLLRYQNQSFRTVKKADN